MTLLGLDHVGEEFADGVPVADAVDLEDLVEVGVADFGDEVGAADAGVVAEDRGGAVLGLDLVGDFFDAGGRGHVALVEEDFAGCGGGRTLAVNSNASGLLYAKSSFRRDERFP